MVINKNIVILDSIFQNLKLLEKIDESRENIKEQHKQKEILKQYQECTKQLLD